jgi:hypothetical protein
VLCTLGGSGLSQQLWWLTRQVRTLFRSLFSCSAWAQQFPVEEGTTRESAALASVSSFGVGLVSHCVGGHDG